MRLKINMVKTAFFLFLMEIRANIVLIIFMAVILIASGLLSCSSPSSPNLSKHVITFCRVDNAKECDDSANTECNGKAKVISTKADKKYVVKEWVCQ